MRWNKKYDGTKESLAIFPKSAIFVKPTEGALYNLMFRKNRKSMEFVSLYNFNLYP